ncbi:MAG: 6,7-dimethyl-8-ribityllumazine synthase [Acidobacteria bacterium]|nr:MAG: 6,7-dimethyl-8-ribityllumazine synthase [Acidobacteriota bacterium]
MLLRRHRLEVPRLRDRSAAGRRARRARGGGRGGERHHRRARPGAFEIPIAAQHAAESGRFDAIVCLGCVIRGETPHFDYICSAVAHGLAAGSAATGVPMAFGVLTTNSVEEALARAGDGPSNKGREAAVAAIEMAEVVAQLTRQADAKT